MSAISSTLQAQLDSEETHLENKNSQNVRSPYDIQRREDGLCPWHPVFTHFSASDSKKGIDATWRHFWDGLDVTVVHPKMTNIDSVNRGMMWNAHVSLPKMTIRRRTSAP